MAKLGSFGRSRSALDEGEWVSPGDEFDDLEIKTRAYNDAYTDLRAQKLRREARRYGGDIGKIPNAVQRGIIVDCLVAHCLQDVRNLEGEDGAPVPFDAFVEMLKDPRYGDLFVAATAAPARVGLTVGDDAEEAEGNSPAHSGSPSNGVERSA